MLPAPSRLRRVISRLFPKTDEPAEEPAPLPGLFVGLYARANFTKQRHKPCFLLVVDGATWRYYPLGLDSYGEGFRQHENSLEIKQLPALRTFRLQCVEALDVIDTTITEARVREVLQGVVMKPIMVDGKEPDEWMVDAIKTLQAKGIVSDSVEAAEAYANAKQFAVDREPFRGQDALPTCSMSGASIPSVAPEPATMRADGEMF